MTFGTLPLPLTLPFSFSDYLLSVPLSGQFIHCCHLNLPGVGEGRHSFPMMPGLGSFSRLAWHYHWSLFSFSFLFPPPGPGILGGWCKGRNQGGGKWQGERPLLPGVSLRASLLLSVLENQQPQISMLMQYEFSPRAVIHELIKCKNVFSLG